MQLFYACRLRTQRKTQEPGDPLTHYTIEKEHQIALEEIVVSMRRLPAPFSTPLRVGVVLPLLASHLISHHRCCRLPILSPVLFWRGLEMNRLHSLILLSFLVLFWRGPRTNRPHILFLPVRGSGDELPPLPVPAPVELEDRLPPFSDPVPEGFENELPPSPEAQRLRRRSPLPSRGFQRFLCRCPPKLCVCLRLPPGRPPELCAHTRDCQHLTAQVLAFSDRDYLDVTQAGPSYCFVKLILFWTFKVPELLRRHVVIVLLD
ncbi:hypothetical protein ATANTOWER_027915 [Ataeniobius toweri]|uniref:Uncharacterized protein n=1 Tax=Ataeniobius toweri TaxID=208326 RepID=A0ABU7BEU7_9TELE|nr:hypothetical protein [Ataeniobius toweri]